SHSCKQENPKIQGKVCCLNRTAATLTAAAACYFLFIFLVYLTRGGSVFGRGDVLCHGLFQKLHGHCFGFLFRYLPVSGDDFTVFRNRYRVAVFILQLVAVFILRPVGACGNITTDAAQSAGDILRRDAAREGMAALAPVFCMIIRP
ncbi:hypothetical protein MR626_13555, partial [bacterium]|nr:hypothetical protein [bacterium]